MRVLALPCILFCCVSLLSLGALLFLMGDGGRVNPEKRGSEGTGGVEGEETVVKMYCIREESILIKYF